MCNKENRQKPAYKLMILLAFFHLHGVILGSIMSAYYFIKGAVFCEYPITIYLIGAFGTPSWIGCTVTGVILSFNRCCVMYSTQLADTFFSNKKIYIWLVLPISLYIYTLLFEQPLLFSAISLSWYFNPHLHYYDDKEGKVYYNHTHTINNVVTFWMSLFFTMLFVLLYFARIKKSLSKITTNDKLVSWYR